MMSPQHLTTYYLTYREESLEVRICGISANPRQGCGVIVIKPLEQAQRDNDSIRAVIAGSGINQDGRTPGITMPCGDAQGEPYEKKKTLEKIQFVDLDFRIVDATGIPQCRY